MDKLKFTPGPRRAYQDPQGDWHVDNWSPRNGNHDGLIVARFGHGPFSEGNAKLDAAAPDLYQLAELLEDIDEMSAVDLKESYEGSFKKWRVLAIQHEILDATQHMRLHHLERLARRLRRLALAKARGEEAPNA